MADSNPYANVGQGMFGQDVSIAKQMSTPESFTEKMQKAGGAAAGGPLAVLAYAAVNGLANAFGSEGGAEGGGSSWTSGPGLGAQLLRAVVPPPPATGGGTVGVPPVQAQSSGQTVMPTVPQVPQAGGYKAYIGPGNIQQ